MADGRSLFIAGAERSQDWEVVEFRTGGKPYIRIANALSYFREHFAQLPAPRGFEEEWQADVKTLLAAHVPNLTVVAIIAALEKAGPFAAISLLIWLGITLYIDWNRRLNTAFVRMLHSSYLLAVAVISVWIGLWTLPLVVDVSIRPKPGKLSAELLVFLALVLPYFFVLAQQIYLCHRLCRDGVCDYRYRNPSQRDQLPWSARRLPFAKELSLRLFFILALVSILVFLCLLVSHTNPDRMAR